MIAHPSEKVLKILKAIEVNELEHKTNKNKFVHLAFYHLKITYLTGCVLKAVLRSLAILMFASKSSSSKLA